MSILTKGLPIFRPLFRIQSRIQNIQRFSICPRNENASLRFTNTSYAFPASPPSQIQPERVGSIQAAFLEEPTEEYGQLENSELYYDSAAQSPESQAAEVILRLIAKGDLDGALAARDEFVKLGIGIVQNRAFAAVAITELTTVDPEVRRSRFIAWWSLTPVNECPDQLALACTKLMDHPFDIPLLMDFCILCAKAGFLPTVEKSQLLPHIFRFGNPNATTAFLLKLEHEAKQRYGKSSPKAWMSIRNLAIRVHLFAGRKGIAMEICNGAVARGFVIEPRVLSLLGTNKSVQTRSAEIIRTNELYSARVKDRRRPLSALAQELRILRRIVASRGQPPHFELFLAEFIDAYELHGRHSRAIRMLREKVFKDGSLAVRARWVAGEQLAYSMRKRPIAVLRTYMNYCLVDDILAAEARPILSYWRERTRIVRKMKDWKVSQKPVKVDWKIWPTNLGVSLAWKAILQLSKKRNIDRLYSLLLKHVEAARASPMRLADGLSKTSDLKVADELYYNKSSYAISIPPAVFPNASYFHHFVVTYATRHAPRHGARVLSDMQRVGIVPSKDSWGALAGAYARSGDLRRVLRILDYLDGDVPEFRARDEDSEREKKRGFASKERRSRTILTAYNSVLRGFTEAAMYPEARMVRKRMQRRGLFKGGVDKRTRTILHRLSQYRRGKYDHVLFRPKRPGVTVDGRRIAIDERRVEWLKEI